MNQLASRRSVRRPRRLLERAAPITVAALIAISSASACLSDVDVPECLKKGSACQEGGAAGSGEGGDGAFSAPGGGSEGGTDSSIAGGTGAGEPGGSNAQGGNGGEAPFECPDCVLTPELPSPCAHASYRVVLGIAGGEPPFRWNVKNGPRGWSIGTSAGEPRQAILTAEDVKLGTNTVSVTAIGNDDRSTTRTYDLRARESCWFAHVSLSEAGPQLQLVDPLLAPDAPVSLAHNSDVYDFAFSPNGRYLAYSYGASEQHPHGQHLAVVELTTWNEYRLSFGDSVTSFAWSPSGTRLAAAFDDGNKSLLGAVVMPPPGSTASPTALNPTEALVDSELSWIGEQFVSWHTDLSRLLPDDGFPGPGETEHYHAHLHAKLADSGFSPVVQNDLPFLAPVSLLPTSKGYYTLATPVRFTPLGGVDVGDKWHTEGSLIAGSGNYSAMLGSDGRVQFVSAEVGTPEGIVATAKAEEKCNRLLAWAAETERVACVFDFADTSAEAPHGEIRFFDLAQDSSLSMGRLPGVCGATDDCPEVGYRYDSARAAGQGRGFSRSGRWFAFATKEGGTPALFWTDLQAQPPTLHRTPPDFDLSEGPTWVSFSPDESLLLARLGDDLVLVQPAMPPAASAFPSVRSRLPPRDDCSENFTAEPRQYCGASPSEIEMAWAADSSAVAFRDAGELLVADTWHATIGPSTYVQVGMACDARCSRRLAFQPRLEP